jgi:hypothetical protein
MPSGTALHALDGKAIKGSYLERGPPECIDLPYGRPKRIEPRAWRQSPEEWGDVVFLPCGDLTHFGHLLTETAGCWWPLLGACTDVRRWTDAGTPVLVVTPPGNRGPIAPISRALGLPLGQVRSMASLDAPVSCRRALVPVPSMINRRWVAPHHFSAVRGIVDRLYGVSRDTAEHAVSAADDSSASDRVYLSRTALPPSARRLHGEERLEASLRDRGWSIVHLQQLSIGEQLLTLARARVIAGEMSSAFHLLMYFGRSFAHKAIVLLGVRSPSRDPRIINFVGQFRLQPVDVTYLACLRFRRRARGTGHLSALGEPCDRTFLPSPRIVAQQLDWISARALSQQ